MFVFDEAAKERHGQVLYGHDEVPGLKTIIATHSTALGPAIGGTRFFPCQTERDAHDDALRLAKGMICKASAAGLGGGKGAIIGDPSRFRRSGTRGS